MPNKHNDDRRHHIPKMSFKVQNWPEYEAGLRRRGSLTLWIDDAVLNRWQSVGPLGQARYLDIAIETALMLRSAFKMALRQTEGLMASVLTLMNLTIMAPDHTTVSRRAVRLRVTKSPSAPKGRKSSTNPSLSNIVGSRQAVTFQNKLESDDGKTGMDSAFRGM